MAVDAVGVSEPGTSRLPGTEAVSSTGLCGLEILARVISTLRGEAVRAAQVHDRAVGLGLLRCSAAGQPLPVLSCQSASRLLLAGYRLPAHVEPGTLRPLREYLRQGLQVFAPLAGLGLGDAPALYQLHCLYSPDADGPRLSLGEPEAPVAAVRELPLEAFVEAWVAAGGLLVVAAPQWGDLPRQGTTFFGGSRDRDGTYHWHVAECVTDGQGCILRY
jgi:hypothetical protein